MTRPSIGARVRVTEQSLGCRGIGGTVVRHHAEDALAVTVKLDFVPRHMAKHRVWESADTALDEVTLSVGDFEVLA